jgi:hypothetical protein
MISISRAQRRNELADSIFLFGSCFLLLAALSVHGGVVATDCDHVETVAGAAISFNEVDFEESAGRRLLVG